MASTIVTFGAKQAVRDVGLALGFSEEMIDRVGWAKLQRRLTSCLFNGHTLFLHHVLAGITSIADRLHCEYNNHRFT